MSLVFASTANAVEADQVLALAKSVNEVLNNIRNWIMGILAGLATVFLSVGGVRYLMAGGDPGEVEKAKASFKSAGWGYGLAALAPLVVAILKGIVGTGSDEPQSDLPGLTPSSVERASEAAVCASTTLSVAQGPAIQLRADGRADGAACGTGRFRFHSSDHLQRLGPCGCSVALRSQLHAGARHPCVRAYRHRGVGEHAGGRGRQP